MFNSKLKLFSIGVFLALPLVAWGFYFVSFASAGKADALPDWFAMSGLIYLVLSAALLIYVARRLGLYRNPNPPPPQVVPALRSYYRAKGIGLIVVWFGGFLFVLYQGFKGRISPGRSPLGACLFLVVIIGAIWLLYRDRSAVPSGKRQDDAPPEKVHEAELIYWGFGPPLVVTSKHDRFLVYVLVVLASILWYICWR